MNISETSGPRLTYTNISNEYLCSKVRNDELFAVWLTNKRRLALSPAGTIVRDPHHRESRHAVSRIFLLFLNILIILPKAAETIIIGALRSRSIHVQRRRVREALNVVDPVIRAEENTMQQVLMLFGE